MESDPIIAKQARRIVSEHYYITSTRVYYIFESCPEQIERTQVTTLNMIRRLRVDEYVLHSEIRYNGTIRSISKIVKIPLYQEFRYIEGKLIIDYDNPF